MANSDHFAFTCQRLRDCDSDERSVPVPLFCAHSSQSDSVAHCSLCLRTMWSGGLGWGGLHDSFSWSGGPGSGSQLNPTLFIALSCKAFKLLSGDYQFTLTEALLVLDAPDILRVIVWVGSTRLPRRPRREGGRREGRGAGRSRPVGARSTFGATRRRCPHLGAHARDAPGAAARARRAHQLHSTTSSLC
jgi:hypothetical protein